jgi:hypothetical protein
MMKLKGITSQSIAKRVSIIFDTLGTTRKKIKYLQQASTSSKATMASTTFFETSSVKDYGV